MPSEQEKQDTAGTEQLVKGVTELATATLGVGAAMARAIAEATAGERPVPPPQGRTTPLNAMVHYSVAAVVNVVGAVMTGVNEAQAGMRAAGTSASPAAERQAAGAPAAATPTPGARSLPTVHGGATLRVPLSIENPGAETMADLHFVCLALTAEEVEGGRPLAEGAVRFEPETLTIGPRDFEKLTVYVDVPVEAASGRYQATIGLANGAFQTSFPFVVAPQGSG